MKSENNDRLNEILTDLSERYPYVANLVVLMQAHEMAVRKLDAGLSDKTRMRYRVFRRELNNDIITHISDFLHDANEVEKAKMN